MGDIHLKHYLFIVGNAEVAEELVKLEAQAIKMADHKRSCDALLKGPRSGEKRRLTDAAFEEATAAVIANDAKRMRHDASAADAPGHDGKESTEVPIASASLLRNTTAASPGSSPLNSQTHAPS